MGYMGINCILLLDSTECWMRPEAFVPISHKSQDKFYMQFSHAQSHTVCACTCGYLHWDCPFCIQLYKRNKTIKVATIRVIFQNLVTYWSVVSCTCAPYLTAWFMIAYQVKLTPFEKPWLRTCFYMCMSNKKMEGWKRSEKLTLRL